VRSAQEKPQHPNSMPHPPEVGDKARKAVAQGLLNKPIRPRELAVQLQRYIGAQ